MLKSILLSTLTICLLSYCSPSARVATDYAEERLLDVSYGSFETSKMDIYLPAKRNRQMPFVFVIHGGGWVAGDKKK